MRIIFYLMLLSKTIIPQNNLPEYVLRDEVNIPAMIHQVESQFAEQDITLLFWGDYLQEEKMIRSDEYDVFEIETCEIDEFEIDKFEIE